MSLVMLPKVKPSAVEIALYQQYPDWFHAQQRQLDHFLTLTASLPQTVLAIPMPRPQPARPELVARSEFLFEVRAGAGASTSAKYTRHELTSMLRSILDRYLATILAERERLVSTKLASRVADWRWRKEKQALAAGCLAHKRQSHIQLVRVVANLDTVYECLTRGVTFPKIIAVELGLSRLSARLYKVGLYNTFLLAVLQGADTSVSGKRLPQNLKVTSTGQRDKCVGG